MILACDTRPAHGPGFYFHSFGKVHYIGVPHPYSQDHTKTQRAARLITRLENDREEKFPIYSLIKIIKKLRKDHPDGFFLAQSGELNYRGKTTRAGQVVIMNTQPGKQKFWNEMVRLGEDLADEFGQDRVLLEIQKDGISESFAVVTPR